MTQRISIGIYFDEGVDRLRGTLGSVRANTNHAFDWLVLADGALDTASQRVVQEYRISASCSAVPAGAAACFNRLLARGKSDVLVFLEAGCLVAPGWLDALLAALDSDPRNGLAGPSTNLAWNEQCAFPGASGVQYAIARTAQQARKQFGTIAVPLEPLHSLADFCYAVKRELVEAIGAADESYQFGPCWEMDYNVRAHRAGFRGVWARASYVHRSPFSARRAREEAHFFEASKRRYQDKFCGLRLQGARPDYEPHCRGDACEHFAPPRLVKLYLPLPDATTLHRSVEPLVSCIMVTRNRPEFVLQSIRYFERQDYANRELIIVDDGDEPPTANFAAHSRADTASALSVIMAASSHAARSSFIGTMTIGMLPTACGCNCNRCRTAVPTSRRCSRRHSSSLQAGNSGAAPTPCIVDCSFRTSPAERWPTSARAGSLTQAIQTYRWPKTRHL
jgi:GT2 family glycosyltransferase